MTDEIKRYQNKKGQKLYKFKAYLGKIIFTGKKKEVSRSGFSSKREALRELNRLRYEFEHSSKYANENITYKEVFDQWKKVYAPSVSESTLNRVLGIFRIHVLPILGNKRMVDIDIPMCQHLMDDIASDVKDFRKAGNYIRLVFKHAERMSFIDKNPMDFVIYPTAEPSHPKSFWNREQLIKFLKVLNEYYAKQPKQLAYLRLLAVSGARKGELLALRFSDINFKNNTVDINKTITRGISNEQKIGKPKTVNSIRPLFPDEETMDILRIWQNQLKKELISKGIGLQPDQLLFPNSKNRMTSLMEPNRWLSKVIDAYHLKPVISPHGFRATTASLLSQANMPMKSIQLILGDNSTDVLLTHYIQQDEKMKRESANQYKNYLGI